MDDPRRFDEPAPPLLSGRVLFAAFIVGVVVTVALLARVFLMPVFVRQVSERYTTAAPARVPQIDLEADAIEAVENRVDAFTETLKDENFEGNRTLVLSAADLNALLRNDDPDTAAFIRIRNNRITVEVAFEIEPEMVRGAWSDLAGRYVHGVAALELELVNDRLRVDVTDLTIQGRSVPAWLWRRPLREELDDLTGDPELNEVLKRVTRLEIVDDEVVLTSAETLGGSTLDHQ